MDTSRRELKDGGSMTVHAFLLLLLLSSLLAGAAAFHAASADLFAAARERGRLESLLEKETAALIALMKTDPTPFSDSSRDPVWSAVGRERDTGVTLLLEDISSAVNPNWVEADLFTTSMLAGLLAPGTDTELFQVRREKTGFHLDLVKGYGDLFTAEALDTYLTPYGYANINTAGRQALFGLVRVRTGSDGKAGAFLEKIREYDREKRQVGREELEDFLGESFGLLFPLVNAEPSWNVHFLPPFLLRAVLSCRDFGITDPDQKSDTILSIAESSEIETEDLVSIVGAGGANRIYGYLGTVTWFWKITATKGSSSLATVIARVPGDDGKGNPEYLVLERRFLP